MRLGLTLAVAALGFGVFGSMGCVASSTPEANGYNVQLFFQGDPLAGPLTVGQPGVVTVERIQMQLDRCTQTSGSCDPAIVTPIVLVSASCDQDLCAIESQPSPQAGAIALSTTGLAAGATTLRVRVRSTIDGSEWEDGYPLAFRSAHSFLEAPAPVDVKLHHAAD